MDHREGKGTDWRDSYDAYRCSMRWFDGERAMDTYYEYRNGFLQSIGIRPCETGYAAFQVRDLLLAMYGEPARTGADRQGNSCGAWRDEISSKYLTLTDAPNGPTATESKFSVGIGNVLAVYPVTGRQASVDDPADRAAWDLVCAILPKENRIDLPWGSSTHDPAGFVGGAFRKGFCDKFRKDLEDTAAGDYEENPTHCVSRYGANCFCQDIAHTFTLFVLGGKSLGRRWRE